MLYGAIIFYNLLRLITTHAIPAALIKGAKVVLFI
ncbi:hypothetical protein KCTC52924_00047 [Arenibacter antarcticus]